MPHAWALFRSNHESLNNIKVMSPHHTNNRDLYVFLLKVFHVKSFSFSPIMSCSSALFYKLQSDTAPSSMSDHYWKVNWELKLNLPKSYMTSNRTMNITEEHRFYIWLLHDILLSFKFKTIIHPFCQVK